MIRMTEGIDYELIPSEVDNDQAWDIRILKGEFVETVYRYGNISIDGESDELRYNFVIISTPMDDLTIDNVELQNIIGDILVAVIENAAKDGSLQTKDRN